MEKEKKLCFLDASGDELFSILDGEFIELIYGNGCYCVSICQYVDEDHFKLDGCLWEFRAFAERMKKSGIIYRPYS